MRYYRAKTTSSWDYDEATDPLVTTNPITMPVTWVNKTSGELFVCIDNTPDSNVWVGQAGTDVP